MEGLDIGFLTGVTWQTLGRRKRVTVFVMQVKRNSQHRKRGHQRGKLLGGHVGQIDAAIHFSKVVDKGVQV